MVRDKLPDAKIGFFLIGFQCKEYTEHFLSTCAQILLVETLSDGVQLEQYFVNVISQPIGINPRLVEESRRQDEVRFWIDELSEKFKNRRIIFARDKLDNVHGVRQKLLAFETFLQIFPEMKENVVMIQIATSATEQLELLVSVSDIVSRIDSLYSSLSHQPLVFLRQDLTLPVYHAILSIADVVMISSLREGMCLTAHDYSFCQDGKLSPKKHGSVILSEFTGSAAVLEAHYYQKLHPTHVSINPWDNRGMAQAIKKALDLTAAEREARWHRLYELVMHQTGTHWSQVLQRTLDIVYQEHHQRASVAVPRLDVPNLVRQFSKSEQRFFVVDYDGTLMPHRSSSGFQPGSPRRMLEVLFGLLVDPRNIVYIMSGRTPQQMESAFSTLPELGLIAENGGYIRSFGSSHGEWDAVADEQDVRAWKEQIMPILEYYRERLDDSTIEERLCSILFRYDKCQDQETAVRQASECAVQINGADKALHIRAVPVNKAVLIEMESFDKGKAAATVFKQLTAPTTRGRQSTVSPDFLMVAGDDREDEAVFRWANELGKENAVRHVFTVTVGKRNTEAQATLDRGATSLLNVLDKLAKVSVDRALPFRSFYQQPNQLPRNFTFPA
ncbi:glycosyltransferase family 20 protein [Dissoconium aciculare CBS 342.82]|uniref:Glycosyltransferase family 20 protein n=1 Tax=Dissoconium aciculare CBS 342.82 TaxID=1314786 RepID=A0A6J3M8K3_9PEZI|nr:glycosyltransferase family 20 protein [Dissoconium aciculare CBS 342.82]KAF1824203.1 glycosyltransferase family 20 protein [Dissoconium aciculare CBS 342.82]